MYYKAKDGSIKEPDHYLGVDASKFQLPDGCVAWSTSPRIYIKNAVNIGEHLLVEDGEGCILKSRVKNPFPSGYREFQKTIVNLYSLMN